MLWSFSWLFWASLIEKHRLSLFITKARPTDLRTDGRTDRPTKRYEDAPKNWTILTPMMAFNSAIVTCLARSTAWATCCWCSCDRNGMICAQIAFRRLAISVWKKIRDRLEIRYLSPGLNWILLVEFQKKLTDGHHAIQLNRDWEFNQRLENWFFPKYLCTTKT